MRLRSVLPACLWALAACAQAPQPSALLKVLRHDLDATYPKLDALYQDLHEHPELSGRETATAHRLAAQLSQSGFEVTMGVGGTGVVGVLRNGPGPTLLMRTELDALPVEERTGLPYASQTPGVMHACGHDIHMTALCGAANLLSRQTQLWHGTLVMVGQPSEETGAGAKAMVRDGLFTRFPKPDFALAVHDYGALPAGQVTWVEGYGFANVDSVDITLFGRSGHGARPNTTVDPIVLAARTILALQTIVSREKDPMEPGVITVGSIHGGTKHNIIPDEVKLQLTVRTYAPEVRKQMLAAIQRITLAEAAAAGAPREPSIVFSEALEACYNDPAFSRRVAGRLVKELGPERVVRGIPEMGGEDFGELGKAAGAPSLLLRIGAAPLASYLASKTSGPPLPQVHSSLFAPDREPTLRTGIEVLTLSALEVLGR